MTSTLAPAFNIKLNNSPLADDLRRLVTDVSVELKLDQCSSLRMSLANPTPKMPLTHGDYVSTFKEGGPISIEMGYLPSPVEMFKGVISSITYGFPESGVPTVTIGAQSMLGKLAGDTKNRSFLKMTDKAIVEKIAGEASLSPEVEGCTATNEYVLQFQQTNLEFLLDRAVELGCELLVDESTLKFRKPKAGSSKTIQLEWGVNLRSFTPTLNVQKQNTEVVVGGYDHIKAEPIKATAKGADLPSMGGSETGADAAKKAFGSRSAVSAMPCVTTQAEAETVAKALFNKTAMEFVTGTGGAVGNTAIKPGAVIQLANVGERFNGPYYVSSASHSIGSGGYTTSFSCRRSSAK